jgi:hypothetical protein
LPEGLHAVCMAGGMLPPENQEFAGRKPRGRLRGPRFLVR